MRPEINYNVETAALILNKSKSWVYRAIKEGSIEAARVGNDWRITGLELQRLLRPANAEAVAKFKQTQVTKREAARERDILRGLKDKFRDAM